MDLNIRDFKMGLDGKVSEIRLSSGEVLQRVTTPATTTNSVVKENVTTENTKSAKEEVVETEKTEKTEVKKTSKKK